MSRHPRWGVGTGTALEGDYDKSRHLLGAIVAKAFHAREVASVTRFVIPINGLLYSPISLSVFAVNRDLSSENHTCSKSNIQRPP